MRMAAARDFRMFFFAEAIFGTKLSRDAVLSGLESRPEAKAAAGFMSRRHTTLTRVRAPATLPADSPPPPTSDPRAAVDQSTLTTILLTIPVLLFALVAHEWAHGYAALKQGDPTAYEAGRLTFNPIKHIDPFMTIILPAMMLISSHGAIALGGAKPCPVNPANFRNYKRGDVIVSLAGVSMNLLLAIVSAILFLIIGLIGRAIPDAVSVLSLLQRMMYISVTYNALLLFFNLLPIPPLDGSHVLAQFLPSSLALPYKRISRFGLLLLVGLLYFGGNVFSVLMTPVGLLVHALMLPVYPFALGVS